MGNRLEIAAAIYTDGVYVDKLFSEDLILDARQSDQVLRVGRVIKALQLSSGELSSYYRTLVKEVGSRSADTSHLFPDPVPLDESATVPKLSYLGKLSHSGDYLDILKAGDEEKERPHAIYLAVMASQDAQTAEEQKVVVKFAYRYNETGHRILAKEGLAPQLHHCIPVIGGLNMIIMDYVEGKPLPCSYVPPDYEPIYADVEAAVEVLHSNDLVFGDLRTRNILAKSGGGAMLVDFDWVSQHGKDRYPASWDDSKDWAEGVGRRKLMKKEHDLFMLEKLQKFLEKFKSKTPPHSTDA